MSAVPAAKYFLRTTVVALVVAFAFVGAAVKLEWAKRELAPRTVRTLEVNPLAAAQDGQSYRSVQDALDYAEKSDPHAAWTIALAAGAHQPFVVPADLEDVTVKGASRQQSVVETDAPIHSEADSLTLHNLTVRAGGTDAAVTHAGGTALAIDACDFAGAGAGVGTRLSSAWGRVTNSTYEGFSQAINVDAPTAPAAATAPTAPAAGGLKIFGNSFKSCGVALTGFIQKSTGRSALPASLVFAFNEVVGEDAARSKVVIASEEPGLVEADIHGNDLDNAVMTLANVQLPAGEQSAPLAQNDLCPNSFGIEVTQAHANALASVQYRVPAERCGRWVMADEQAFGANFQAVSEAVARANERGGQTGDYTLSLAGFSTAAMREDPARKDLILLDGGLAWEGDAAPKPASVALEASVSLRGAELKDGQFDFVLRDAVGNAVSRAQNDAQGHVRFDSLDLGRRGTHVYSIEQVGEGQDGVFCDLAPIDVTVAVAYDCETGALVPHVGYSRAQGFENAVLA